MKDVLVSVVVPIYNCENYIEECIKSILNQSFTNLEVILIDDGSTDKSGEICDYFAKQDNRICVMHRENKGVALTRKEGIDISNGEFITFIDSDDYIDRDFIKNLYNEQELSRADIVCCNSIDDHFMPPSIYNEKDETISDLEQLMLGYYNGKRYAYCIWGKLFRKNVFNYISFPDMKYAEDTYVVLSLFSKGNILRLLKYKGYHYRYNPNGAMGSAKSRGLQQPMDVLKCVMHAYRICRNLPKLKDSATKKLIDNLHCVIHFCNGQSDKMKQEAFELIREGASYCDKKYFFRSINGIITICYLKFPKLILRLLELKSKIQGN